MDSGGTSGQALGSAFETCPELSRRISIPLKGIYDKDLTETIARLCGFHGRIVWDTTKPNPSTAPFDGLRGDLRTGGQPRRKSRSFTAFRTSSERSRRMDVRRASERCGFPSQTSFEAGLRRTIQGDFMLQDVACAATAWAMQIAPQGRCGAGCPSTRTHEPVHAGGRPAVGS